MNTTVPAWTLKYERLFIDEMDDAVMLAKHAEEYRIEYNQIRPTKPSPGTVHGRCTSPGQPVDPDL